ncbi:hypothetical protein SLOPH_933 [Spraguea lophii 42_110]|uniref:Uncharacterized protein n=1 Tax=Spraguea lophii (strain 42_110) TaxID=1358809 RepID=S7XIY4_SPRLO|nr:hypothetical protein SLOPH_933 [Spraguea lophii 42_110]
MDLEIYNNFREYFNIEGLRTSNEFFEWLYNNKDLISKFMNSNNLHDILFYNGNIHFKEINVLGTEFLSYVRKCFKNKYSRYFQVEREITLYLGENIYYKPELIGYYGYNRKRHEILMDRGTAIPSIIIETFLFYDKEFKERIKQIYSKIFVYYKRIIVIFIDLVFREMYILKPKYNIANNETNRYARYEVELEKMNIDLEISIQKVKFNIKYILDSFMNTK